MCVDIICCRAEPGMCCVCGYHLLQSRAWSVLCVRISSVAEQSLECVVCVWISSVAEQSLECVVCEDIITSKN